ncbi:hypothetical protein Tco_0852402 [Tanacetum coccineum]
MKKKCMDKGSKERSPPHNLRQKPSQYICCQNHKLIADIENDIMDPVMQCTTLPSHRDFLNRNLFICHGDTHVSIDISFRDVDMNSVTIEFTIEDGKSLLEARIKQALGEGKDESMGGMGGGSLARRSMVSNDGRGVDARGGEDNGGGVDLGVSKRLSLLLIGDICGIKVWEVRVVGGAPDT